MKRRAGSVSDQAGVEDGSKSIEIESGGKAQIRRQSVQPVSALRASKRVSASLSNVQDLFPLPKPAWRNPWRAEGELVGRLTPAREHGNENWADENFVSQNSSSNIRVIGA